MPKASSKDVSWDGLTGWRLSTYRLEWPWPHRYLCPPASPGYPLLHFHPEPLLLPGLTPATDRLTWPLGTTCRLRCLLLSETRGLADFCQGVLPTGHGTLPALDTIHHTLLTPPQVQITATHAPGCSRTHIHPAGLPTAFSPCAHRHWPGTFMEVLAFPPTL